MTPEAIFFGVPVLVDTSTLCAQVPSEAVASRARRVKSILSRAVRCSFRPLGCQVYIPIPHAC